jgi:hypothetical protein
MLAATKLAVGRQRITPRREYELPCGKFNHGQHHHHKLTIRRNCRNSEYECLRAEQEHGASRRNEHPRSLHEGCFKDDPPHTNSSDQVQAFTKRTILPPLPELRLADHQNGLELGFTRKLDRRDKSIDPQPGFP